MQNAANEEVKKFIPLDQIKDGDNRFSRNAFRWNQPLGGKRGGEMLGDIYATSSF